MAGDGDEDVEFTIEEIDVLILEAENFDGNALAIRDFVPANFTDPQFRKGYN
jgi:hypothetical protein